jgi:glycerol-3-phosphate O-acyltransferase
VAQLLVEPWFAEMLRDLADRLGRDVESVQAEAATHLRGLSATHNERADDAWRRLGGWFIRAYDVFTDDDKVRALRALDRKYSLVLLPSHRSYLDWFVWSEVLAPSGISAPFSFGGANLNFFPLGSFARRTGIIFIRRSTTDAPVYRTALRAFMAQLVRNGENLSWSIEGGRTRTGKLRPPAYGILRYLIDAVEAVEGPEIYLVPMSIVYDQLHEVALMTTEARGGRKNPEDIRWLVHLARQQGQRLGRAYLDIGEVVPLRQRLAELRADHTAEGSSVERIALDLCYRINRATPVTVTAVATLALLGADRALAIDEVLATVRPLSRYISHRHWPVAGAADLTDRSSIRRALQELVASGVVACYDGGTEPVWGIAGDHHLVAAFYRNTMIHILVDRAISEVALLASSEGGRDPRGAAVDEALRLRDLLKFEFFFSPRDTFLSDLGAELEVIASAADPRRRWTGAEAERWLHDADLLLAHLVLRPFLDAYGIVADRLADHGDEPAEGSALLTQCLRLGRQWQLQRRIASAESVSLELFKTAIQLARHRGLVDGHGPDLAKRRDEFAEEIRAATRRVGAIAEIARAATAVR